ncbi:MAG: DUF1572 family protein [Flavobacteriia bacterium]|nr:DUF1572 family protein [Flavobacteriia bacterium]MBH2024919.1 DUF1572 family protein [Flavobacteriales bacterium]
MKEIFIRRFLYYKELGDKTFVQLNDEQLRWQPNSESNSIAVIVKHLSGNMISRWTNFLIEDGEKPWRNRDTEFVSDIKSRDQMLELWKKGWAVLFEALNQITENNIHQTVFIRGEKHTVLDAVLRQLAHYPYHIGQIIYVAKILKNGDWQNLSIPKSKSAEYNTEMLKKQNPDEIPQNSSPVCFAQDPEVRDEFKS